MKDPLKILDKYDKKENIYKLILKYAEKGHNVLGSGATSISDDSLNILDILLKEVDTEEHPEQQKPEDK
ncbi:MAG: hypothetical protein NC906_02805 [Candidatus Omnitrophica bacterium]|nr:hypothetical protein [Candidatus Omnitrophota bacterium]MCM8816678.1 hypothetical protein [Candidatus Omnitrophota bacterium]